MRRKCDGFFMGKMTSEVAIRAEIFHGNQTSYLFLFFSVWSAFFPFQTYFHHKKKCHISTRFDAFSTPNQKKNFASEKNASASASDAFWTKMRPNSVKEWRTLAWRLFHMRDAFSVFKSQFQSPFGTIFWSLMIFFQSLNTKQPPVGRFFWNFGHSCRWNFLKMRDAGVTQNRHCLNVRPALYPFVFGSHS